MLKLDNWVHYETNILKEGRLVHLKPEIEDEEVNEEELMKKIE
jgi:hypothetical protein